MSTTIPISLKDSVQEINTAEAMKAANYTKPNLHKEVNKSANLSKDQNKQLF